MGGCRCSYKGCTSMTTPDKTLHFFHYPVKVPEVCDNWIKNAEKPQFKQLTEDQLRNKVVCEHHFEDKCFPNLQKKRLLKNAVPTLDGPAVSCSPRSQTAALPSRPSSGPHRPSTRSPRGASPRIELLSANDDATLFVLDTSTIDFPHTPRAEIVESYIYQNGSLLPSKEVERTDTNLMDFSEVAVKQIDDEELQGDCTAIAPYKADRSEPTYSVLYCENSSDGVEYPLVNNTHAQSLQNTYNRKRCVSPEHKVRAKTVNSGKLLLSESISKKYLQKIRENRREIASVKQFIRNNMCVRRIFHNKSSLLHGIKRFVPPSLYSVLRTNLGCNKFLSSDLQFFISIYEKSPEVYDMLSKEYKWNLPDVKAIKPLMNE